MNPFMIAGSKSRLRRDMTSFVVSPACQEILLSCQFLYTHIWQDFALAESLNKLTNQTTFYTLEISIEREKYGIEDRTIHRLSEGHLFQSAWDISVREGPGH